MDVRNFMILRPPDAPGTVGESSNSDSGTSTGTIVLVGLVIASVLGGAYLYMRSGTSRHAPTTVAGPEEVWSVTLEADGPKGFGPITRRKRYHMTDALGDYRDMLQQQSEVPPGDGWRGIDSVTVAMLDPSGHVVESKTITAPRGTAPSKRAPRSKSRRSAPRRRTARSRR